MNRSRATMITPPPASGRTLPIEGREGARSATPAQFTQAKALAKRLRRGLTGPEARLWVQLKRIRTVDTHFRKQVPIGPYVADFACLRGRLVIEVDGYQHAFENERRHDSRRTAFLEAQGFRVLRFWNHDILREMEAVLDTIHAHLHGAVDVPGRSMSKRRGVRGVAPSSPSMGEVASASEPEGAAATAPGLSAHPAHRGEKGPAAKPSLRTRSGG